MAAAVGKNWILSPPSPCLYTIFNVCPLFINNALDGEVHDQKKVGGVKGIKFRGTTQNPEIIVTPPVDLHWFFEISIRTEKKFQLELKKNSVIN